MKKIAITGASGLLGREIVRELSLDSDYEIYSLAFTRSIRDEFKVDLTDSIAVNNFFKNHPVDLIIHCAAERRPDRVSNQQDKARSLNIEATETLVNIAKKNDCHFIYISTDYVFDGKNPPFKVDAKKNPLNLYGEMKSDGEGVVLNQSKMSILRVPILFGPTDNWEESSISQIIFLMKQELSFEFDDEAVRYPTWTPDVAHLVGLMTLDLKKGKSIPPIIHFSGDIPVTKYEMAIAFSKYLGIDPMKISALDKNGISSVARPMDAHLECGYTYKRWPMRLTLFDQAIKTLIGASFHSS